MNCNDIENLLYDYATENLNERDHDAVKIHLMTCGICKVKLGMINQSLPLLDQWSPPKLSADFADQVLKGIPPERKPLWQRTLDSIRFPIHFRFPMQALAGAALVFLAIIVYRAEFIPEPEKITREITINTQIVPAKSPIIIETRDAETAFSKLKELIFDHGGSLAMRKPVEGGMEVAFSVKKNKEKTLFQKLPQLGKVQLEKEGYINSDGNIVIVFKEK